MDDTHKIEPQKKLAKHIIDTLKENGFNAIIAGGAVRDWYHSRPATDLDIFIAGKPAPEAVVGMFGVGIRSLGDSEKYSNSPFEGFECDLQGEKVQFLFHDVQDPRELVPEFPVSICQCWWDGDEYWFSEWFSIGERYSAIIYTDNNSFNIDYLCKIESKFRRRRTYSSVRAFFKSGFKPRQERRWTLDDLEGPNLHVAVDF